MSAPVRRGHVRRRVHPLTVVEDPPWREMRESVVRLLDPGRAEVLDVGAGPCPAMALALARHGCKVVAIDINATAVRRARECVARLGLSESITAKRADGAAIPFPDEHFARIVAFESLNHVQHLSPVVRELARVCRSGGRVVIADLTPEGRRRTHHPADDGFLGRIRRYLARSFPSVTRLERDGLAVFICQKNATPPEASSGGAHSP